MLRAKLLRILDSNSPAALREGAAYGLARSASRDAQTAEVLLRLARRNDTSDDLKSACAWALEDQIKRTVEVANIFKEWLGSAAHSKLQRVAAQALAKAMARDQIPWDSQTVERIEHVLMNLSNPCPHALESLEALATAREVRCGLRLENVLRETLKPISAQIEVAFVFGSIARRHQSADSDIDLMIIGDVTLKDLSVPLRDAERTLGRHINPALYTREVFRQRYHAGDPFLLDVYRREKIAVITSAATAEKDLEDELGSMVAERLAPAG